jgi:hypothetical protein
MEDMLITNDNRETNFNNSREQYTDAKRMSISRSRSKSLKKQIAVHDKHISKARPRSAYTKP